MEEKNLIEQEEVEVEPEQNGALVEAPLESNAMDALIKVSQKIQEYEKAINAIMNFVMRQTYAGDWVSHARAKDPVHLRSVNLSASGAERVAKSLGINESNWKEYPKEWSEDRKHYGYRFEADFSLGGRTIRGFGECSTRNKFFSFENGAWKELGDVREDFIRKAAIRETQKDGVRRLLGLRKIPLLKLKELGFNLDLVQYVNFKDSKEAVGPQVVINQSKMTPESIQNLKTGTATIEPGIPVNQPGIDIFEIAPTAAEAMKTAKGNSYYIFKTPDQDKFSAWGDKDSETVGKLLKAMNEGRSVKCEIKIDEKKGYKTVTRVLE